MSDEKRKDDEQNEVEGHGAKQVVAAGLAGAALIGAGAAGVKYATDDGGGSRNQGALVERDRSALLEKADANGDGYLDGRELAEIGWKWNPERLQADGYDVSAEGLTAAGIKIGTDVAGKDKGFPLEGESIVLLAGVDDKVDELIKGDAVEWTMKHRELDRDEDGYTSVEELERSGLRLDLSKIREDGYKVTPEELAKAEMKFRLASLGEGGYETADNLVMMKWGVDDKVDAFIKGE